MEITINGDVYFLEDSQKHSSSKKIIKNIRSSAKVTASKKLVKSRDKCCMCCGESEKQLQVHHILPLTNYPDLASDVNNMITLCQHCHTKYHQLYEEGDVNAVTFSRFMKLEGDYSYE